jgi:hypothetical protein
MIQKWSDVQELRRRNHGFDRRLRDQNSVVALNFPGGTNLSPYEYLVAEAISAVQRHKGRSGKTIRCAHVYGSRRKCTPTCRIANHGEV